MKNLFLLSAHILAAIAKLLRPGGARALAAENLLLKHQLLIISRSRHRAPNLTCTSRKLKPIEIGRISNSPPTR